MDRPTARRRRHANNVDSVSVAELKAKSTPAEQAILSEIQARAAAEAGTRTPPQGWPTVDQPRWGPPPGQVDSNTEPVRLDEVVEEPRTSNRLTMTIIAMVLAMVTCGAVTAVATLGGGQPHRLSPTEPIVLPGSLSGPMVVRPDLLIDQLAARTPGRLSGGVTSSQPPARVSGTLVERGTAADVVTDFYSAVPKRPREAFGKLGPTMQTDGLPAFESAWIGTRFANARVLPAEENDIGLRVSVSIEQLDGTLLQLVQLVEVRMVNIGGTPQPRIVSVQLLSAHRS